MKINALILGSTSPFRAEILRSAGLTKFSQLATTCDESQIQDSKPEKLAELRARAKGLAVPAAPYSIVIAADQVAALGSVSFNKVTTAAEAAARLKQLQGHTHFLHSAFSLVYVDAQGLAIELSTRVVSIPMAMRELTDREIAAYVDTEEWRGCVGCYRFEAKGAQLFTKVGGSSDAIIGLPLQPLLADLRRLGVNPLINPEGPWEHSLSLGAVPK